MDHKKSIYKYHGQDGLILINCFSGLESGSWSADVIIRIRINKEWHQDQDRDQQEVSSWTVLSGHSHRCFVTFSPIWKTFSLSTSVITRISILASIQQKKMFHLLWGFLALVLITLLTLLVRHLSAFWNLEQNSENTLWIQIFVKELFADISKQSWPVHICTSCVESFCTVFHLHSPPVVVITLWWRWWCSGWCW